MFRSALLPALSLVLDLPTAMAAEPLLDTDSDVLLQAAEDLAWGDPGWFEVPGMSLDVRTGHARSELGEETYVMAALNLPLERLGQLSLRSPTSAAPLAEASPRSAHPRESDAVAQSAPGAPASEVPPASDAPQPADARREPRVSASPSGARGTEPARAAERAQPSSVTRAPALPREPVVPELPGELVDEVLARAERSAGVSGIEARIGSLARRARTSGLVPELRVRGMHGVDQSTSLDSAGAYPGDSTVRDGLDALVEVRLTFELDRLVFGSEEPGLVKQLADAQERREKLEEVVTDLLLDWFEAHERLTRAHERVATALAPATDGGDASRADVASPDDAASEDGLDADERARRTEKDKITVRRSEVHLRRLTGGWFRGAATLARYAAARAPER